MRWETPSFIEINMSAEIGGYGSDFSDGDPLGPVVAVEPPTQPERAADGARR